ncbi:MAG: hypothetical protein U0270_25620 [Labilithrix sp.]
MPEATTLYSVTGVVVVGLVAWVAMVLKQAKEPWSRPALEEPAEEHDAPEAKKDEAIEAAAASTTDGAPKLDADDTARATPVALSEGRQKAEPAVEEKSEPASDEKKDDEKKSEA